MQGKVPDSCQKELFLAIQDSILELLGLEVEDIKFLSPRYSNRAKRLIFKFSVRNGFEIIIPQSYNHNWVLEAIIRNKLKIKERLTEIKKARTTLNPTSIALPATRTSWKIVYKQIDTNDSNALSETSTTLYVPQKADDPFWVPNILQQWLQRKAFDHLPRHLHEISIKLKLSYNVVKIKRQKTCWGSCSIKRNINLNRNLILMPSEVVDYVLHHELVHLKVLNHSTKFWKELEASFPNYRKSLAQLKTIENTVPSWACV